MLVKATFKDGVVIPESVLTIPDGTQVEILVPDPQVGDVVEIPPELKEEFEFWDRASDFGWQKFLQWERETSE